jgi:ribonuclease D
LQDWRKQTGQRLGVPSDVVLPRDVLNRVAWGNPADLAKLEVHMHDVPYRFQRFGQAILAAISQSS